jgi:excisionase family DNA binding protein
MNELSGGQTGRKPLSRCAVRVNEFCELYGVSRSFAYELMDRGKLRTIKLGKRRLIPVEAAEALLRA